MLVILGLLTGGILAGQSLIRAAELRSAVTEYQRYVTAIRSFKDKYMALPGDMANATAFWGKDNASCTAHSGTAASPGTCNGDGDGYVEGAGAANTTGEDFRIWQHLALAGLIEGSYTGNAGPSGAYDMVIGTNVPASKLSSAGWGLYRYWSGSFSGNATLFDGSWGEWLQFGADAGGADNATKLLRPEEAWNLDTKLDDGKPGYGNVIIRHWDDCTDAASSADLSADYALNDSSVQCVMMFLRIFR